MKPPRAHTPEDLAKRTRKKITLYLNIDSLDYVEFRANKAGTSISKIIDLAIVEWIRKDKKTS